MSKLNISPNLFLEVNELNRLIKFLSDDGYKSFLKCLSRSFGIVRNKNNTYFKVSEKNGEKNTVIVNSGIAIDSNLNRIYLPEDIELEIPNTEENYWILISYASTNDEDGVVEISEQGMLSGTGTEFTSVLRGQPNFPVKVKFNSELNVDEYEVVDVISDTSAIITGSLSPEQNLKYQVIGTFTPGFQPNDNDKTIYEYDYCKIDVVESESIPYLLENQYVIAKISRENNKIVVTDERLRNTFNYDSIIDDNVNTDSLQSDPFVALRQASVFGNQMLDIQFEWGYTINDFEIITTSEENVIKITEGSSKYISLNNIPNGIFKNWLLVNRKNMTRAVINDNVDNNLYVDEFNPIMFTGYDDELVIVPNSKDIEVEVSLNKADGSNSIYNNVKHFFKFSIENLVSRFYFPVEYGTTTVKLRYRLIYSNKTSKFQYFSNSQFKNINGLLETLGESSFTINISPEEELRNYS